MINDKVEVKSKSCKDYILSFDIGSNSIGWAIIRKDVELYHKRIPIYDYKSGDILSFKDRYFWGSLLFNKVKNKNNKTPASIAREKRNYRRRIRRRKWRLKQLRNIFAEEMKYIDDGFFKRLDESFLQRDNKIYPIFNNKEVEKQYHSEYPTIYHLRKALIEKSEKKFDLRLVFLALSHIMKYRGNFLHNDINPGEIKIKDLNKFGELYNNFIENFCRSYDLENIIIDSKTLNDSIMNKNELTKKLEEISKQIISKEAKANLKNINNVILGKIGSFKLNNDNEIKISFTDNDIESKIEELKSVSLFEKIDFDIIEELYLNRSVVSIFGVEEFGNSPISSKMVEKYENLKTSKLLIKKYCSKDKYKEIFKDGKIDTKKIKDILTNNLQKKILSNEDAKSLALLIEKINENDDLYKQRSIINGCIPYQLHWLEMKSILDNQKKYYPFLGLKSEMLLKLLTAKIPYYVGPLTDDTNSSRFAWMVKNEDKKDEKIDVDNLEEVINKVKTAERFMEKLIGKDTYLPNEEVLPINSLVYQKFCVLNELAKVRYEDNSGNWCYFDQDYKEKIIKELFYKHKEVKLSALQKFIKNNDLSKEDNVSVKGINDDKFNSTLSTYIDLKKMGIEEDYLNEPKNEQLLEELVRILTVFEDADMRKNKIDELCDQDKYLAKNKKVKSKLYSKHYKGWGRLSYKLLCEIRDKNSSKNIIDFLLTDEYHRNFMQLINSNKLPFKKVIQIQMDEHMKSISFDLDKWLNELYADGNVKRAIRLCMKIFSELKNILHGYPKNIVIEMARENQETSKTKSRYNKLNKIYQDLSDEYRNLKEELDNNKDHLDKEAVYLYFSQEGKDMYTGDALSLEKVLKGIGYQVDHIFGRCKIKNESLDNKVLVSNVQNQEKGSQDISSEIVNRQKEFWKILLKRGLISSEKYYILTEREYRESLRSNFLRRQLVETRQITKQIADFFITKYEFDGYERPNIFMLNSKIVSSIRQEFDLYKIRELNDRHHAQDAYLNAVVAYNLIDLKEDKKYVYGDYQKEKKKSASDIKKAENNIIEEIFVNISNKIIKDKTKQIDRIKYNFYKNSKTINVIKRTGIASGEFYKATILPANNKNITIPLYVSKLKNKEDKIKHPYGGYTNINYAYFALVKCENKISVNAIPIFERKKYESDNIGYLREKYYSTNNDKAKKLTILINKLPYNTLFEYGINKNNEDNKDKYYAQFYLCGKSEMHNARQFDIPEKLIGLLYIIIKANENTYSKEYDDLKNKLLGKEAEKIKKQLSEIHKCIIKFLEQYELFKQGISQLKSICQKIQEIDCKCESDKNIKKIISLTSELLELTTASRAIKSLKALPAFDKTISDRKRFSVKVNENSTIIFQTLTGLKEVRYKLLCELEKNKMSGKSKVVKI